MFYKGYTELSIRAKGVIEDLGGIEKLIAHYEIYGTCRNIRICGLKTKLELERLIHVIKKNGLDYEISSIESRMNINTNTKSLSDYYKEIKPIYNTTLGQFLSDLEEIYRKKYGDVFMEHFLKEVFISPQKEFLTIKSKIKVVRLFDELKTNIVNYSEKIESLYVAQS